MLLKAVGILAISGATAGLLGIGGALIFNPYLLQLGMDPRVSPAGKMYSAQLPLSAPCSIQDMLAFIALHSVCLGLALLLISTMCCICSKQILACHCLSQLVKHV